MDLSISISPLNTPSKLLSIFPRSTPSRLLYLKSTFLSAYEQNGLWLHYYENSNYNTTTIGKVILVHKYHIMIMLMH